MMGGQAGVEEEWYPAPSEHYCHLFQRLKSNPSPVEVVILEKIVLD